MLFKHIFHNHGRKNSIPLQSSAAADESLSDTAAKSKLPDITLVRIYAHPTPQPHAPANGVRLPERNRPLLRPIIRAHRAHRAYRVH